MTWRRSVAAIGLESKVLPDTASCALTIFATKSCSSRRSRIISGEAGVAWPACAFTGSTLRSHWLLNNNPPKYWRTSQWSATEPLLAYPMASLLPSRFPNERLKFKQMFKMESRSEPRNIYVF